MIDGGSIVSAHASCLDVLRGNDLLGMRVTIAPRRTTTSGGTMSGGNGGANERRQRPARRAGKMQRRGHHGDGRYVRFGRQCGGGGTMRAPIDWDAEADAARDVVLDSRGARRCARSACPTRTASEYLPPGYGDGTKRASRLWTEKRNGAELPQRCQVLVHGPPKLINLNQWPADRPFIVLSPASGVGDARPPPRFTTSSRSA